MSLAEELKHLTEEEIGAAFELHHERADRIIGAGMDENPEAQDMQLTLETDYPAMYHLVRLIADKYVEDGVPPGTASMIMMGAAECVLVLKQAGENQVFPD